MSGLIGHEYLTSMVCISLAEWVCGFLLKSCSYFLAESTIMTLFKIVVVIVFLVIASCSKIVVTATELVCRLELY